MTEPEAAADDALFDLAQRGHHLSETLHVVVYFAPEPAQEYLTLGLRGRPAYFASRGAALGAVPGPVIAATFAVFDPDFVARAFPRAWELAPPAEWLAARHRGVAAVLHRLLGDTPDVSEALDLAWEATTALSVPGRPLYAAHAALPWPQDPVLALWHATTLLREHRGDGHIAALTISGLDPLEAMVLHGITSRTTPFLRTTRGWTETAWAAAVLGLQVQGLLDDQDPGRLTSAGQDLKHEVEHRTRAAALAGWAHLGLARSRRLVGLLTPIRDTLMASDVFPAGSPLRP